MGEFVINDGVLEKYLGAGGDVVIPDGVREIGAEAFAYCDSLTGVTIPDSVCYIGEAAFNECANLVTVKLSNKLESINDAVFAGCTNLREIAIPDGVNKIGNSAFSNCWNLSEISFPDSVDMIGDAAFSDCVRLEKIQLTSQVSQIGEQAFAYCNSLESIIIPSGPTLIGPNAFAFCKKLSSVTLGGMKTLCFGAFAGCPKLTEVVMEEPVDLRGARIFQGCPLLADEEGFVIIKGTLYDYCGKASVVTVPEYVEYVDEGAFSDHEQLIKVIFPEGFKNFADGAFDRCRNLVDEQGFNIVRNVLFEYWGDREEVTIPDGITAIGKNAFAFKENLKHLHVPARVKYIGDCAFENYGDLVIHAPAGSYAAQYAEDNWIVWVEENV